MADQVTNIAAESPATEVAGTVDHTSKTASGPTRTLTVNKEEVVKTQEEVDTVKELEYRSLETGQEQNGYWLGSFTTLDLLGWDFDRILKRRDRIDSVSIETLHTTFSNYYSKNDHTVISLYPENHEPKGGSGSQ